MFTLYISKYCEMQQFYLKNQWIFVILLSLFVTRNFKGTCSSFEILKGYMVRERLGTPALAQSGRYLCLIITSKATIVAVADVKVCI